MSPLRKLIVNAPSRRYPVYCGRGALRRAAQIINAACAADKVFLLSSPIVWKHLSRELGSAFPHIGRANVILFDDREAAKNLATVEKICRALVKAGADRQSTLVAVGGGVVGDVAGYAAASYLRGVSLVHIPTTLVAQVDSAIGGKTGVNLPEGKNLVGAFYQPDLVIADPSTLRTLPEREYRSGLCEVIKYGVIADAGLFRLCERDLGKLLRRDPATLDAIIPRCIAAKARVTTLDERESGLRETLNFGHTFAHVLESVTRYRVFRHGEAVGWGMIAASLLGIAATGFPRDDAARVVRFVRAACPLPPLPRIAPAKLLAAMRSDKKSRGGRLRFVLPLKIGRVRIGVNVPDALVTLVWRELTGIESAPR